MLSALLRAPWRTQYALLIVGLPLHPLAYWQIIPTSQWYGKLASQELWVGTSDSTTSGHLLGHFYSTYHANHFIKRTSVTLTEASFIECFLFLAAMLSTYQSIFITFFGKYDYCIFYYFSFVSVLSFNKLVDSMMVFKFFIQGKTFICQVFYMSFKYDT